MGANFAPIFSYLRFWVRAYDMLKYAFVSFAAISVSAQSAGYTQDRIPAISFDEIERLAQHPTWLKMGRYKSGLELGPGAKSDIITDAYFLAENGATNPQAELVASIEALTAPLGNDPDNSIFCQFPGRVAFLRQHSNLSLPDPALVCPEYAKFVDGGAVDGISVLFIGSYLENPGSAFGHLLLRFHSDDDESTTFELTDVLGNAINYGAADSENDALAPYIVKGLTGKYHSTFTTLPFFQHSERFREEQLRNIWEYRLDIDEKEVDLLTGHVWELLGVENRYYFLRQNCAYRIAELVELVTETDIISEQKIWVAPMDVFHAMMEEEPPIIKGVKRLASRETIFNEHYLALTDDEKQVVDIVLEQPEVPVEAHLSASSIEDEAEVLNVLLDRLAYGEDVAEDRHQEVLVARFGRAPAPRRDIPKPTPPHEGQKPSLFQTSVVHNEDLGTGLEFRARPAYFDFLSKTVGTAPYSELAMADTRVLVRDGEIYLRQLEAVRVTALNANVTGAPGANRNAWRVRVGLQNRDLACDGCLVGYGEGGLGRGYQLADGLVVYGLGSAQLELGGSAFSTLQAKAITGLVWTGDNIGVHVEGAYVASLDNISETKFVGSGELRFGGGDNWEFRSKLAYDEALESSFSINFFW